MSNKFCTFFVDNFGEKTNLNIYNVTKIVSYETSTLFLTNGSVFGIGKNDKRQLGLPGSNVHEITLLALEDVVDVSMNEGRTLFITKKNQLFGAGSHWYSALGHLSDTAGDTPMLIPSDRYNNEKLLFGAPAFSFSVIVTDKSLFVLGQV
jgi:alpha-tubulin suppressor-like RCC1 family protein